MSIEERLEKLEAELARANRRNRWLLAVVVLGAVGLSDLASSHLMKPLLARVRPCHVVEPVFLHGLSCRESTYSFPSSHAANIACACLLLSWRFR